MPDTLEEVREHAQRARDTLHSAIAAGREQLHAGRALTASMWRTIEGLTFELEERFRELEAAERMAGVR